MNQEEITTPHNGETAKPPVETPTPPPDISQKLIALSRASETPPELLAKRAEFEAIYNELPAIADTLIKLYRQILTNNGLNPGKIQLYLVGGRVKGTPIKADSDLDLIFTVEHPNQALEMVNTINGQALLETMDTKIYLKRSIIESLNRICAAKGIINYFHILDYGTNSTARAGSLLIAEEK